MTLDDGTDARFRDSSTAPASPMTRFARLFATAVTSALLTVATVHASVQLPDFGEPADRTLSPAEEQDIGERIVAQLLASGLILDDPQLNTYVSGVGARLASFSGGDPNSFRFFMIRDDSINAFALPGGFIGIHTGLLIASETESELAAVLAHEEAHVTQRHIARQLQGQAGWNLATAALVIAAALAGAADPDLVQAALGIGLASAQQRQINHTRSHELEADRLGIGTLARAGFDPRGMAAFFERLHQQTRLYGNEIPEILLTHPVSATRVAEAMNRIGDYPSAEHTSSQAYHLMKARARVLSANPPSTEREFFQRSLTAESGHEDAAHYGLALIAILGGDGTTALDHLRQIDDSDQINLQIALAEAEYVAGNTRAALDRFAGLMTDYSRYQPLTLAYADVLIRSGESDRARRVLLSSSAYRANAPEAFRLLALAARDSGREPEAHYQMAAYFRYRGNYAAAINQLSTGLQRKGLTDDERDRLRSRLDTYRRQAPERLRRQARSQLTPAR